MKTRLSLALVVLSMFALGHALRAADAPGKDVKCPVSGQPISADSSVDFNGGKVYFCCDNCPKEFQSNTAKYAGKANLQLVQTGQLEQVACPIAGRPTKPSTAIDVAGVKVAFCCNNCKAKAEAASGDDQINLLFANTTKGFKTVKK